MVVLDALVVSTALSVIRLDLGASLEEVHNIRNIGAEALRLIVFSWRRRESR